jgi:hypothetical protein
MASSGTKGLPAMKSGGAIGLTLPIVIKMLTN